jgi:hypothetical protein
MCFRAAVEATLELKGAYRAGLKALSEPDRSRIVCPKPRRLAGSVNLETALRATHAHDPLWDYAIGWKADSRADRVIWAEVHPASSSHVGSILKKAAWLRTWLKTSAPRLNDQGLDLIRRIPRYLRSIGEVECPGRGSGAA